MVVRIQINSGLFNERTPHSISLSVSQMDTQIWVHLILITNIQRFQPPIHCYSPLSRVTAWHGTLIRSSSGSSTRTRHHWRNQFTNAVSDILLTRLSLWLLLSSMLKLILPSLGNAPQWKISKDHDALRPSDLETLKL